MEIDSEVWIKGKESRKNANDGVWIVGRVISKDVELSGTVNIVVRTSDGTDFMFSSNKGGLDLEDLQLKNVGVDANVDNLIELPYLNEPEILQSLSTRYFERKIYTYTGNILIAINPKQAIVPDASCEGFLGQFASEIKTLAVGVSDSVGSAVDSTASGEVKRRSIIISGESGSGKTEVAKLLTMLLISAEVQSSRDFLGVKTIASDDADTSDEEGSDDGTSSPRASTKFPHSLSQDSMMNTSFMNRSQSASPRSPFNASVKDPAFASPRKSVFFKAYQLSTMERIRQVTPILETFGNACIAHTQNSSRLGKYVELSFSKRGDLVGGEFRTYLLENVRVTRQLENERNFHIFYQLAAGASEEERRQWALGDIATFHYANQGGKAALKNPLVDDVAGFERLKDNFASLGFEDETVESVLQIVAGILHLGQVDFTSATALEGQVAQIIDKVVTAGSFADETELDAAARLCSLAPADLKRCLTVRSVLLNKELFHKSLTPQQALSARDALAKAMYKRLFTWLVQELNGKLRPTDSLPAQIASSVGILDIFGFDAFAVNSFEQLCINYANEALQQHFAQHMFKLELQEYKREGIPFEDIEFPDNQESLDLITNGIFTILDDQCRIPNPTDKRYASQLYKELGTYTKFSSSASQVSANQFCVHHFAGPVVYSCDNFIEKNLDELPQDAAELLKGSRNAVLTVEMPAPLAAAPAATSAVGSDAADAHRPPVPVMAAYVSKPKVEPGARLPGAPAAARRGSLGGKGVPYSVVAQLKNEVSVMMAHINTTTPHYVCCINPVERLASSHTAHGAKGEPAKYQPHIVAAQLRYGGILGAVKVARSGLPYRFHFVDFFQRYRCLANPLNPVSLQLASHVSVKDSEQTARGQCELLIEALTNISGRPLVVSAVQNQLADEVQWVFRKRYVRKWMASIGGVVNEGGGRVGATKVFINKQAHTLLESCLYHMHALCRQKIGSEMLRRIHRKRYLKTLRTIAFIQRVMRGAVARSRARILKRKKAEGVIESASQKDTFHVAPMESEVRELKRQDALIQEQIKRLVASNKVTDEPEFVTMDFAATKQELNSYAARFPSTSVINVKALEASESIGEGYQLLRPEKLIPLNAVSKALSFGRNAKTENRATSVKSANKVITKDHAVFKTMHKLMDRLRELFELAKLEKEVLETRRRNKSKGPAPSGSGKSSPIPDTDFGDLDIKMSTLDKLARLSRSIYQYYHQYILEMVKEYGFESRYRASFGDDNQYLLAFVALVEAQKPILSFEKSKDSATAGADDDAGSGTSKSFPLYVPSERQQGPQHQGYLPLCSYNGVHFKVLPPSHAPGIEYSVNSLHRLLRGRHMMYPIKYLKIIGKSGEGKGRESFYQAAMEFGTKNLAVMDKAASTRLNLEDFSALLVISVVFGAKVLHPQNIMTEPAKDGSGETRLVGLNCDEGFLTHLFRYKNADANRIEDLNVLYMMPEMDAAINPTIVKLLSAPGEAIRLVSAWLRELSMQNKRFAGLKSAGFVPADLATLSLPVMHPPHAGAQVQHMMIKLSKTLQQATAAGRVLTHSDLLASAESALAERYAELRIRYARTPNLTFQDIYKDCHAERGHSLKADAQIKSTFSMDVDHMTAEVLNTLDFRLMPDSPSDLPLYSALFDNFSFLPSLHLRNISDTQLALLFHRLLEWNKQAYLQQLQLRPTTSRSISPLPRRDDNKIHPAVRTAVKSVCLCGLDAAAVKQMSGAAILQTIQQELGIRVTFEGASATRR